MPSRKRPGSPSLAVAYIRASTGRQELSPEAQRSQIVTWAKCERVTVVAWFTDHGVSGGADLSERAELAAALGALRAHGAGVLAVAKRDRLARDVGIATAIDRAVAQCGARVVCADGVANGDTAADQFLRTILDGASQYERDLIRSRTRAALVVKRAKGEMTGAPPFGYRLGADGVHIEPDEREQAAITLARTLHDDGHSLRGIVSQLATRGVVGRTGRPLALTQVARLVAAAA